VSAARPPEGAHRQQPLSTSWREFIQSAGWNGKAWQGPPFDAIVVGSGYGGSVAALRLAEKNHRVLLLERGSEYLPGEFPNDFSLVPKFFRVNLPAQAQPMGRASGLVELHLGEGIVAVTGNGLGGGSLINAGVAMQPDDDVFAQPQWPAAIRHRHQALAPYFEQARDALAVQRWSAELPGGARLHKTAALERLARRLGASAETVDACIDAQACQRCGDCAAGCNVPGAKRTLASTYLQAALATGRVQIVSQAEVYRFELQSGPAGEHLGWRVHVFATDAQQQFAAPAEVLADPRPSATGRALSAPLLFVCAGTLGSTRLLQRSQARSGGRLAFSPALGQRLSGNGDSLSFVVNEPQPVAAVGRGAAGVREWRQATGQQPYRPDGIVGPTITARIDLRRPGGAALPLEQRLVVEDGAVPRTIAQLHRELLATTGVLKGLDGWWFPRARHAGAAAEDPLAASEGAARHSQVLLVMGHDGSPGRIAWCDGLDTGTPSFPQPEQLPTYRAQQALFDRIGARHLHNPLWRAMPRDAVRMMSGPRPQPTVTTVHPLGGCAMADHPDQGVVDDRGQVWLHDPGRGCIGQDAMEPTAQPNEPRRYRGLYVLDGSIVPTALGCNPLLTITALAERALEAVPARPEQPMTPPLRGAARAPQALPSEEVRIDARLNEELRATLPVRGALAGAVDGPRAAVRLQASFHSDDIVADLRRRRHALRVEGTLAIGPDQPEAAASAVYRARGGCFEPLRAGAPVGGPWLFLRTLGELFLLLAAGFAFAGAVLNIPVALWNRGAPDWSRVGWTFLLLAAAVLLPLARTLLTWGVLRGQRDWPAGPLRLEHLRRWLPWALALFKQMVHAGEKRVMRYEVPMDKVAGPAGLPRRVTLHARKVVVYRASIPQLLAWCLQRARGRPAVIRPTFWEQVMHARVRVVAGGRPRWAPAFLRGTLRMGFDNLTSSGQSSMRRGARGAIELGERGDTTSGMLALAGYPLLFLRFALQTRLLDFRLPTYSEAPVPDCSGPDETALRTASGPLPAECSWLTVPRGQSSSDEGDESTAPLQLPLWRYRRRDARGQLVPATVAVGTWLQRPVRRARAVLLLHAFGQSGLSYTLDTVDQNLAEAFHAAGYEVWVLETRMSTRSGYADRPCTVDQIAEHDVPAAVRHILAVLEREHGPGAPLQIGAFGQCMGAAALAMALLSGRLSHQPDAAGPQPRLSMLWQAMFSQVHPWLVGSRETQAKTWMPALLQALWRRGSVPFAVRGPQPGVFLPILDRILASMPAPPLEDRRPEDHDDAAATCRRLRFIEAPLFRHENIGSRTFAAMNRLFGEANLRLFAQAGRFVDRERLVDEDGSDRYVTEENLRLHLAFPVQLLHGQANELFDAKSARRSFTQLGQIHGGWQQAFCKRLDGSVGPILVEGYGHLDVLIGDRAARDVFPQVLHCFEGSWQVARHAAQPLPATGWLARPPRIGPFLGWLRREPDGLKLRVTIAVDARGSLGPDGRLPPILVRYKAASGRFATLPGVVWRAMRSSGAAVGDAGLARHWAWADLPLSGPALAAEEWQVLTLHPCCQDAGGPPLLPTWSPGDAALNLWLKQAQPQVDSVLPPLAVRSQAFDAEAASFRVPARALASLQEGRPVTFAVGCCRHPGLGLDAGRVDRTVDDFLAQQRPSAFALLLGDQIYADATAGLVDPASPIERYHERHELAFGGGLGRLLAQLPVYLTPDDHEWADGYPLGGPLRRERWPDWRPGSAHLQRQARAAAIAGQAVTAFQRLQSPLREHARPRYSFQHGCSRFFVIDTRSSRQRELPQIVHPAALSSLRRWLQRPEAQHCLNVVACGSVVLPGLDGNADPANPGCVDTWQYAPQQRQQLLEMLVALVPGRFLLLSGDYHLSAMTRITCDGRTVGAAVLAPPLYAPMPYANAAPEDVFLQETVPLAAGTLALAVPPGGEVARGSGLGLLDVQPDGRGGFELRYRRRLRVWESGETRDLEATLAL